MLCNIIEKLIVPTVTWWYTFCEAYAQIIEIPFADLNHTSQRKFKCMNDREYQFLKEYCSIMKPFTVKLLLARFNQARSSDGLNPGQSQMTIGLPKHVVGAIKSRFVRTLNSKDALLAAVSLPTFKLRRVKEEARKDHTKFLLSTEYHSFKPVTL